MKAVFFDFDGTLTLKGSNVWKQIWQICELDTSKTSYYSQLFMRFMKKEITHQQWCDLTCAEFKKAKFSVEDLNAIADKTILIQGLEKTLKELKNAGYSLHIVSGNIVQVINRALGDNIKYFDTINANKFSFDENGIITHIKGTNYDFEGKAKFIDEFKEKTHSQNCDLVFVGNGDNDEWAHLSGCKTICINPDNADYSNKTKWHACKDNVDNLTDILPLFNINTQQSCQTKD